MEEASGSGLEQLLDSSSTPLQEPSTSSTSPPKPATAASCSLPTKQRFAPPKSKEEVEAARNASMAKKTREDME